MKRSTCRGCAFLSLLLLAGPGICADGAMRYLYPPPESAIDQRYVYQWRILGTALERTKAECGPYVMEPSAFMTEKRQAFELCNATGRLSVMYLDTTPRFEHDLIPVRIPVDKGLVGYRVFLVRQDSAPRFSSLASLDDLRKFRYGLGLGWLDVRILEANGFNVVTGSSYDGLFDMLVARRFDVFLRAATEVAAEYALRKEAMPTLQVERSVCLYYPLPMYFWFAKTTEGRRLAERAEKGMRLMIADGTYDRIFAEFYDKDIRQLDLRHRKRFTIANPFLGPETPLQDKRLWFDPQTYVPLH